MSRFRASIAGISATGSLEMRADGKPSLQKTAKRAARITPAERRNALGAHCRTEVRKKRVQEPTRRRALVPHHLARRRSTAESTAVRRPTATPDTAATVGRMQVRRPYPCHPIRHHLGRMPVLGQSSQGPESENAGATNGHWSTRQRPRTDPPNSAPGRRHNGSGHGTDRDFRRGCDASGSHPRADACAGSLEAQRQPLPARWRAEYSSFLLSPCGT